MNRQSLTYLTWAWCSPQFKQIESSLFLMHIAISVICVQLIHSQIILRGAGAEALILTMKMKALHYFHEMSPPKYNSPYVFPVLKHNVNLKNAPL